MLPEKLSNQLCSLRPREDKLTFSAIFQLNKEGEIANLGLEKQLFTPTIGSLTKKLRKSLKANLMNLKKK